MDVWNRFNAFFNSRFCISFEAKSNIINLKESAAARRAVQLSDLVRVRYYELMEAWFRSGHWWEPSAEELLEFLEGDL